MAHAAILLAAVIVPLLATADLPEGEYHTAAGMVLALLGRVPARGDRAEWGGWSFEVTRMDGLRISRLTVRPTAKGIA